MQLKTSYCKQMHFVKVTEPFVSTVTETWELFFESHNTRPIQRWNGCRLNKDVYKIIAQKPAKTPAQILWTRFLNLRSAL